MTSLATPALAEATRPVAPAAPAFGLERLIGLLGVLLAVLVAGINEGVTRIAMADIRGAMFIGADEASWLIAWYSASSVAAMAFAPWFAVTLSLRRFTLGAISVFVALALLCPLAPNQESLLVLRMLQGLAAGCLPPMLMTVALRFLPPPIKIFGLAGYALTATFGPGLGTPLAALWVEYFNWQWTFWQVIPPCLVAMLAISHGIVQDPPRLERLRRFNWRGLLLGLPAIVMTVLGLLQGNRLDWFESSLISWLLGGGLVLMGLFLVSECFVEVPFFNLRLLAGGNLSHALLTLAGVLVVLSAVASIPSAYLAQVHGYRPLQTAPLTLLVALPQLLVLPLVAALCNIRRVDCRWVLCLGLLLLGLHCALAMQMTSAWIRDNFYLLQVLQVFGQPMAVLPLLIQSTSGIAPPDGPFASAWFNTVRGLSTALATGLLEVLTTRREHFHSTHLVDRLGNAPWLAAGENTQALARRLHEQAVVLTSADLYYCMGWLAVALILLIPVMTRRVYPPRASN
ncbi:MFS transporter [Pseudomonas sp. DTU_2021_1001937_2_SI_NGA_ILE_001]|uniref:MFS transporter n=1 Tax=Pseudomonas sp. DTU_2021_1001937_2_SI_NGA_ILE_001 TaxID=3077589 RepID=UPI0028FC2885|nr:MFS transporter [Pseudomonas sp. DTU_2021_1001937_2_SI_NGA_ILE_001]WNW10649.1 MFS transporter [Pseudomonas sp. DTU_2021_1001937_2_SI_NGA_ILE_001]